MGKKNSGILSLYFIGMVLTAAGFCLPIFSALKKSMNGFSFVTNDFSIVSLGVLLIFIGAAAGAVLCFVTVKNARLLKLIALAASILGGIILIIRINDNAISKFIGKQFLKHTAIGFYLIIAGWIAAAAGYLKSR